MPDPGLLLTTGAKGWLQKSRYKQKTSAILGEFEHHLRFLSSTENQVVEDKLHN